MTNPDSNSLETGPTTKNRGRIARWLSVLITKPVVILLLAGALGTAAVVVTYDTDSTLTTSSVDPPIQFAAGDDAGPSNLSDYVSAYSISTNKTYMTATVNGVPEATLTVDSFFKLTNTDDASVTATLSTSQVANAKVDAYTLEIYDNTDTLVDTLDLTAASPSASATIPTATTYYAKLTLTLASGTPGDLGPLSSAISLSVA